MALLLIGAHFSIGGGLHKALLIAQRYRCTAVQIFTKNATTWKERIITQEEGDIFRKVRGQTGVTAVASHASYLINLASPEERKLDMSKQALASELKRSAMLDIPYVVLHPGSHMGTGEETGLARIAEAINQVFDHVFPSGTRLLLETTAGQGSNLGYTFEQLAFLIKSVRHKDRVGVCLDTCHVFAAGYDIRTPKTYNKTMEEFDKVIGLSNLYLIHVNDSRNDLGSRKDRHEHIGKGFIGPAAFAGIMNDKRLEDIPKILETPKGDGTTDYDAINLKALRDFASPGNHKR